MSVSMRRPGPACEATVGGLLDSYAGCWRANGRRHFAATAIGYLHVILRTRTRDLGCRRVPVGVRVALAAGRL
jgi:hypothetical protein